jgi:hypothetical protein
VAGMLAHAFQAQFLLVIHAKENQVLLIVGFTEGSGSGGFFHLIVIILKMHFAIFIVN